MAEGIESVLSGFDLLSEKQKLSEKNGFRNFSGFFSLKAPVTTSNYLNYRRKLEALGTRGTVNGAAR